MPLVHVIAPDGTPGTIDSSLLATMPEGTKLADGPAAPSATGDDGGLLGTAAAAVLGAGSTATMGLTDRALREGSYVLGGPKLSHDVTSELRTVRERNPYATGAGELGGLLLNPEALSSVGEAAGGAVAARAGEGLLAKMATSAARTAADTAAMGAQHQITEDALGDHEYNGEAVFANASKDALLGLGLGAGLGAGGYAIGKVTGLGGKAVGLLSRRSGPLAEGTLDEIAGAGAGRAVSDQAAKAEEVITGLRGTGATSDQAVKAADDIATTAKARTEAGIGSGLIDQATDAYTSQFGGERKALMDRYYADQAKTIENAAARTEQAALDMRKTGTSVLRNIEDVANDVQFSQKPDRFAKLIKPELIDTQADEVARHLQDTDAMLSFWESTASKGGLEGGISKLRKQYKDVFAAMGRVASSDSAQAGRDLFIQANRFKQQLDRFVPYGRTAGAIVDGKATMYGLPEATQDIADTANRWRKMLEDETVWGDAGAAQARENASFSEMKARRDHFMDQLGVSIDQAQGVRIPEIDYAKTRGMLDKVTGNPEVDEALQPVISTRRTIDGMRARLAAIREGGVSEGEASKLTKGEADLAAFEKSFNGALKEAAETNRIKAATMDEKSGGIGGILGLVGDAVTRPYKTIERLAHIKHTVESVENGARKAIDAVFNGGAKGAKDVAEAAPRPKAKIIEDMESIRGLASNPAALETAILRMTGDLSRTAPKTANEVRLAAIRAIYYLAREAPPATTTDTGVMGKPTPRYSDIQVHDWETKRNAAFDPRTVLHDMKRGVLNRDAIQSAEETQPKLFAKMQQMAIEEIAAMEKRGELDAMPYQRKAVISALLKVPADRTWEPDFIAMMQGAMAKPLPAPGPKRVGGSNNGGPAKPPPFLLTEAQRIEGAV